MRKIETQEQAPLTAAPDEHEAVPVRALRAVPVASARQALSTRAASDQTLAPARSRPVQPFRRPFRRALEDALNGGDSAHRPWADLFETLSIGLASGMTTPDALRYAGRTAPPLQRAFCEAAARQTAEGVPLHAALAGQRAAPAVLGPILEHGELNGTLESAARRASRVLKRFAEIDRKFAYSAISPDLVPVLAICTLLPLAPFVLGFATSSVWPFLAVCALGAFGAFKVWQRRDQMALRQPKTQRKARRALRNNRAGLQHRVLSTARWSRTLFALMDCGVPISSALEAAADAARNRHYAEALRRAAARTREGRTLRDSLADTQLLPSHLLEMVHTSEIAGDMALLDRFADTLEDDAKMLAAQRFARLLIVARLFLGSLIVMMMGTCLGADLSTAIRAGLLTFAAGLFITWLLFLTQARNDL